eukprot:TRINITY_DN761_c0_g1_i2.p1 TRINITY_DN761_c0_g1~~TRINITY_DN761_c0_g1_i2.p1  ORF type:complete len:207 (+),score=33.69 TRINITY_DN761_c0_g1_i2:175-795(+)
MGGWADLFLLFSGCYKMAYANPGYGYGGGPGGGLLGQMPPGASNTALPPLNATGPRLSNAGQDGGSMSAGSAAGVSKEDVLRLIRTDAQFRSELRDVITEFLQPEIEKLKEELLRELPPGSAQTVDRPKLEAASIIQKEFPGSEMSPWVHQDTAGVVYGFPETIEIDVIKHNNMSYLCSVREVRSTFPSLRSRPFPVLSTQLPLTT